MVNFVYFHSIIKCGIIFWGNSTSLCHVFTLKKRIIRIMCGGTATSSCRNLFQKLDILPLSCPYIFSLIVFIVDNQKNYQTDLSVHGLDTRKKNQLYLPTSSLSCLQKGVSYAAMKIFNSLPNNIKDCKNNRMHFNIVLCKYLTLINFVHLQNYLSIIQITHKIYI